MAQTVDRERGEMSEFIERHTEPNSLRPGHAYWRVRERGVPIWALIGALALDDRLSTVEALHDTERLRGALTDERMLMKVATEYQISREAVEAAIMYYWRYKAEVDARLLLNAS